MSIVKIFLLAHLSLISAAALSPSVAATSPLMVEAREIGGGITQLDRLVGPKGLVIFAREANCPISERYGPRIREIEKKYRKAGFGFTFLNVGQIDIANLAIKDRDKFSFMGPYLVDPELTLAKHFGFKSTTEVMVFSNVGELQYRGAVDDQMSLLGTKPHAKEHYLVNKLDAILKGEKSVLSQTDAPGCLINYPGLAAKSELTFNKDIFPILEKKCVNCHREKVSTIDLSTYNHVKGRAKMILHVIKSKLMPPWSVKPGLGPWVGDLSLTSSEEKKLTDWLSSSMKEGDGEKVRSISWSDTWRYEKPDLVLRLPKKTKIPADGSVTYRYFTLTMPLKKDVWVKSYEMITQPRVVHHVTFVVLPPGQKEVDAAIFSNGEVKRFGWAVGSSPEIFPAGVGALIPASAKIGVQVHYAPVGEEIVDTETRLGLRFHDSKPKFERKEIFLSDETFAIPPQASDYSVKMRKKVETDMYVSALYVHMHVRGKKSEVNLIRPSGKKEMWLDMDSYKFNHQLTYEFSSPKFVPKGSTLECVNHFDNSSSNPLNPDPNKEVKWGEQTTEEMSNCTVYGY